MPPERIKLPCRKDFIPVARHAARNYFAGLPIEYDAELTVSELATNSVLWSASGNGGEVTLLFEVDTEGRSARIEVTDAGPLPRDPDAEVPDEQSMHGRGLQIVDRIAKEWGHKAGRGFESYWAVLTWS